MIKEEQMEMEFMKEYEQREVDRISLLQYENLREHFGRLIDETLGENYYNMGLCVYSCDRFTVDDLIYRFNKKEQTINFLKPVAITSLIVNMIVLLALMIIFL